MSTIRKTVSMPQIVHEAALEFSDYIQALIRADTGVQPFIKWLEKERKRRRA